MCAPPRPTRVCSLAPACSRFESHARPPAVRRTDRGIMRPAAAFHARENKQPNALYRKCFERKNCLGPFAHPEISRKTLYPEFDNVPLNRFQGPPICIPFYVIACEVSQCCEI